MNQTSLVIMAAGIGSRYGSGIKQLEKVGPDGEIIMDYSIHDAIRAGFNKVIFIIRRDLERDFKEIIGNRIAKKIPVEYVFQEIDALPNGFTKPEERMKPWGTGHAVLCCKGIVKDAFAVINADDFYGKDAFIKVHDYLCKADIKSSDYCMAGFVLGNTLSDNGEVTRGVCKVDGNGMLQSIEEVFHIVQKDDAAVGESETGTPLTMSLDSIVSMNMWGFTPSFLDVLELDFTSFLSKLGENSLKSEFLLPTVVGNMIRGKEAAVKVLKTTDKWFGVTYKEDKEEVVESIRRLVDEGKYQATIV